MIRAEDQFREGRRDLADGLYPQAILALSQVVESRPDWAEAHTLLGRAYAAARCTAAAEDAYRTALQLDPSEIQTWIDLIILLNQDNQPTAAHAVWQKACQHNQTALIAYGTKKPKPGQTLLNLARGISDFGYPEDAVTVLEALAQAWPREADAHYALGTCLLRLRRPEQALDHYRKATALSPGNAKAAFAESSPLLMLGDYQAGWAAYEHRLGMPILRSKVPNLKDRLWDGSPLNGRRLLVHVEQGSGDTLQFIRYLPLLRRREGPTADIAVLCEPELARLLAGLEGCEELHAPKILKPIPYDCQIPLISLPHRFGTTLDSIPAEVPYLHLPEEPASPTINHPPDTRLAVGIVWAGSANHGDDRLRSSGIDHFATLFDLPGVQFYSLQVGPRADEIKPYLKRPNVQSLTQKIHDYADTLAILTQLDLLIAVDTSVVHLAGAAGLPAWVLLSHAGEWRWFTDREDSPWYPSIRLFRQTAPGAWTTLMEKVKTELARRAT